MNISTRIAAATVAGALTMVAVPAIAQDAGDDAPTEQVDESSRPSREERRAEFTAALAEELGIPVEELEAAMEAVKAEFDAERLAELEVRLEQKVEAGELTQQEADEILAAAEAGDFPHRGRRHGHGPGHGPRPGGAPADAEGVTA